MTDAIVVQTRDADEVAANDMAALATFIALTFIWTWGLWAIIAFTTPATTALGGALFLASAFGPGFSAIVTVLVFQGPSGAIAWIRRCLRWRVGWAWYAIALVTPPLVMCAALGLLVWTGGAMPPMTVEGPALVVLAQFATVTIFGGPLGEEFGWRGYALPALTARVGWRWAAVAVGVVWGLWHLPLFWMPGTAQSDLPVWLFLASTIALSVLFARLSLNTGHSVLLAVLLHGSINWSSMVLPVMPNGGDASPYNIAMGLVVTLAAGAISRPDPAQQAPDTRSQ